MGIIGKRIIELTSCHSTNDKVLELIAQGEVEHGDIIIAVNQTKGRGQKGNFWESEPGKNLTFSVMLEPYFLKPAYQFELTVVTSLAIVQLLKEYGVEAKIKWPNDIYINKKKIAGVLIENKVKGTKISAAVIGIGLNVNQKEFFTCSGTSLYNEIEKEHSVKEVLFTFFQCFNNFYTQFKRGEDLRPIYFSKVIGTQEQLMFDDGDLFRSKVESIDDLGRLELIKDGKSKKFGIKEVKFLDY